MQELFGRLEIAFASAFGSSFALFGFAVVAALII